jgi:hypothetical protein
MKNIHVLPTDKPSRLHFDSKLFLSTNPQISRKINSIVEGRNIYITSDEEIKDVRPHDGKWQLETGQILNKFPNYLTDLSECKLVIMTTDQDLIKDGVQAIDDEFLEWFVKNPSCEEVGVEKTQYNPVFDEDDLSYDGMTAYYNYKIIIPKEEAKQSAVEWLFDELAKYKFIAKKGEFTQPLLEQANKMFEQQIIDAHFQGVKETVLNLSEHINIPKTLNTIQEIENGTGKHEEGEDYYNETFKTK